MTSAVVSAAVIDSAVRQALARTYGFRGWPLGNEAEFKHELFHQLALVELGGTGPADQVPDTPSCRLHAEGKVENGNARKADLLICEPHIRRDFNYQVAALMELKRHFSRKALKDELEKIASYSEVHLARYLVFHLGRAPDIDCKIRQQLKVTVLGPDLVPSKQGPDFETDGEVGFDAAVEIVKDTIRNILSLYGSGRKQYHSFFWCNYEHEQWRRHSFPCEGDFVAHLYHRLRRRLPFSIEIRSEVNPPGNHSRVDLVVYARDRSWGIPIDVKMNWDQFKPAYLKDRSPAKPEALKIIDRLAAVGTTFKCVQPVVVVIQGAWQLPRDIRSKALPFMEECPFLLDLAMFDEARHQVDWRTIGRPQ